MVSPTVIPAKAGIQESRGFERLLWTPAFAGVTKKAPPRAFRVAGAKAFAEAGITHKDVYRLMIYDAYAPSVMALLR